MNIDETLALLIGGTEGAALAADPIELLERVAGEVRCFDSPADALDGLCARQALPPFRHFLFVVDQRGGGEARWASLAQLAHLGIGPVILLVEHSSPDVVRRARRQGIGCLDARELSDRPGVLVRAARRALANADAFASAPLR
jgi:hypothetical protein